MVLTVMLLAVMLFVRGLRSSMGCVVILSIPYSIWISDPFLDSGFWLICLLLLYTWRCNIMSNMSE